MLLLPLVEGLGQVCHALVCRKKLGDEVFAQSEASLCTRPGMKGGLPPTTLARQFGIMVKTLMIVCEVSMCRSGRKDTSNAHSVEPFVDLALDPRLWGV